VVRRLWLVRCLRKVRCVRALWPLRVPLLVRYRSFND
jgi:hypothetical protein